MKDRRVDRRPVRARRALGAACMVLVALSAACGGGDGGGTASDALLDEVTTEPVVSTVAGGAAPPPSVAVQSRPYRAGDCVVWDPMVDTAVVLAEEHATRVVPCEKPHLVEIVGEIDAGRAFDRFPSDAEWDDFAKRICRGLAEEKVFGGPFDPAGRFSLSTFKPSVQAWARGERTAWCVVAAVPMSPPPEGVEGPYTLFTGKVAGQSQTLVDEPGTCRVRDQLWPVSCDQPHHWEVTGAVDLTDRVDTPPPPDDTAGWTRLVGAECRRLATAYLGKDVGGDVRVGWAPIGPSSWAAGRRLVQCTVSRYQNGEPVAVTGTLRA